MSETIKSKAKESPATTEKVAKAMTAVAKRLEKKIYLGPNISGLTTFTIFESEPPVHVQNFIKDCPEIEKLCVPISKMADVEKRINEKGTLEYRYYQKILGFKSGKGEE